MIPQYREYKKFHGGKVADSEYPYVMQAEHLGLDEQDLPGEGFPIEDVTWPDGRVDALPHTCANSDLGPSQLLEGHQVMHLGSFNINAGMVGGYLSVDLGYLGRDVFYCRGGDIDESQEAWYLRGTRPQVIDYWIHDLVGTYYMPPLLWAPLILCSHYGLLEEVPAFESDSYGASLFAEEQSDDMEGVMLDFWHDLAAPDINRLVHLLEADGCTWPREVARRNPEATADWAERVSRWTS